MQPLAGHRQNGEHKNHVIACNDYLRMGPGRSLAKLVRKYAEPSPDGTQKPPTSRLPTLKSWSNNYDWVLRAEEYDTAIDQQKTAYAEEMLHSGLALDYERVHKLKDLSELLFNELMEEGKTGTLHNLWLPDVKQIGSGKFAEKVDIERYNSPLISDIRGLLDDLAKETGGRVRKSELTGKDGGPVEVIGIEYVRPEPEQDGE